MSGDPVVIPPLSGEVMVVVRGRLRPGTLPRLMAALPALVEATRATAACLDFDYYVSPTTPLEFVSVQRWRTVAAAWAQMESPHAVAFRTELVDCVAEVPVIHVLPLRDG